MLRSSRLAAAIATITLLACSSTGTIGPTETYMAPQGAVWGAAIEGLQMLDADIQAMNRSSGVILARMPFEVIGTSVLLTITVRGTGVGGDLANGIDVQVSARETAGDTTNPEHLEALRDLEERYLALVTAALR